ncbi:TPA: Cna B-type domain-containing protein [Streptococcus equi subsp. zooepidemicus]|nr:Cna B-type domain-containing protein [Streptococcus equi subsp. zooepidemicus]HEL0012582.1 Cna B-type domain-containing protein [Streptococcus equi subsp. zooepidemicus]HEL0014646.1 Cna B-type domain-containing protein [Streptococcus equi subsp. zooepidemicus]HEL0018761.1 Cna B-type domain-containing protein [Streptococcus equi subsp. zooepidemicus]HEL0030602.1 Cna B-type domain-containing protein [Streptococcus equi subsp. zooepidemicus]
MTKAKDINKLGRRTLMKEKIKRIISVFLSLFMILSALVTGISASNVYAEENRDVIYEGYTDKQQYSDFKAAFYVREKGSTDRGEMVFCFNESKKEPNTIKEGTTEYTKVEGSTENFTKQATQPRIKDGELKKKVLSVIYNAYHNKYFDKMGLSEGKLREVVQYSIWYFTDNTSRADGSREGHFQKPENAVSKKLFDELIKGVPEAPANFELDLYLSKDGTKQDLLGTHIVDWEKEIKLVKEDADTHEKLSGAIFKFVSGDGYVGDVEREYTSSKDNQTIKIPSGIYRVTEKTPPKGYLVDGKSQTEGIVIKIDEAGNLYTRSFSQDLKEIWTKIENKELKFENKRNPDEPQEETVTLKVNKNWDIGDNVEHPETKFGLFKNNVFQEETVKTLSKDMNEITWDGIKKDEVQSYKVFELTEKDGKLVKASKYINLEGKTYEIFPDPEWKNEGGNVYSLKIINALTNIIVIDKEWQNKSGEKLEVNLPTTRIHVLTDKGTREDKVFDNTTTSNEYYISASLKIDSFFEENVKLKLNESVEVTIGGKIYLATLSKTSENHYKVINQEKPDKSEVEPIKHKIEITKNFSGELKENQFEFKIDEIQNYKSDDDYKNENNYKNIATVKNDAKGHAEKEFTFEKEGTYRYRVSEVIPTDKGGIEYDNSKFIVTIQVNKNTQGKLEVDDKNSVIEKFSDIKVIVDKIVFHNKLEKDKEIDVTFSKVEVNKTVELDGAHLKIVKGENPDGEIVKSWISGNLVNVFKLKEGTYTMVETKAPDKYKLAESITFRVTKDGKVEVKEGEEWVLRENSIIRMGDALDDKPITPLNPATVNLEVRKAWHNAMGEETAAPVEKVKVQLFKDGVKEGEAKEITSANSWKVTFEDLKVSEKVGSKNYEYTVKEVDDNGNIIEDGGEIKFSGNSYKVSIKGNMKDGFTITNTEKPSKPITPLTPAKTSLKVEKEWKGIESKDAPEVTVYLVKNKVKTDKFIKLNKDNNWQGEFKDLDVVDNIKDAQANKYTVVEDGEKDGKVVIGDTEYKVTYVGGKVVNTKVIPQMPLTPGKTSLKVEKEWKGIDSKEAPEVAIYLVKNGVKTNKFIKLNKDNKWKGEFKDLELVDDIKADKGNVYTIVEDGEINGKIVLDGKEYKVTYVGGKVVNTKVEKPVKPEQPKDPQKPGEPKKPETPGKKTPDSPKTNTPKNLPKTGDNSNIGMFVGLLALSAGALTILGVYKKRKVKSNR